MLGGGLGLSQAKLRHTDPCVELGAPSLIGTQTWVLQGELADMSLHPLPWGGTGEASGGDTCVWEPARLVQGQPSDSLTQPVPEQEWGPQRFATGWTPTVSWVPGQSDPKPQGGTPQEACPVWGVGGGSVD